MPDTFCLSNRLIMEFPLRAGLWTKMTGNLRSCCLSLSHLLTRTTCDHSFVKSTNWKLICPQTKLWVRFSVSITKKFWVQVLFHHQKNSSVSYLHSPQELRKRCLRFTRAASCIKVSSNKCQATVRFTTYEILCWYSERHIWYSPSSSSDIKQMLQDTVNMY